jgi:hypothetical protein
MKMSTKTIEVNLAESLETYEIIECQGEVESTNPLDSQILGYLLDDGKKSELIIQNKLLDGPPKTTLAKPLYTLQKNSVGEYEIVGVVREKYLFKTRPNPLSPRSVETKTGHPLVMAHRAPVVAEKVLKM